MPFKSEKQRKYLWANEPEIARDWTDTYGSKIHKADGGRIGFYKGSDRHAGTGTSSSTSTGSHSRSRNQGGVRSHHAPAPTRSHSISGDRQADFQANPKNYITQDRGGNLPNRTGIVGNTIHNISNFYRDNIYDRRPHDLKARRNFLMKNDLMKLDPVLDQDEYGDPRYSDSDWLTSREGLEHLWSKGYTGGKINPADDRGNNPYMWPYETASAPVEEEVIETASTDPYAGSYRVQDKYLVAEGGRVPAAFGGIMDSYTGRRAYGLGSIFKKAASLPKKAAKVVKKLVSSDVGKLALGYLATAGLAGYGAGNMQGFYKPGNFMGNIGKSWTRFAPKMLQKEALVDAADAGTNWKKKVLEDNLLTKGLGWIKENPTAAILGSSLGAGLYTAKQPVEELDSVQGDYDDELAKWEEIYAPYKGKYRVQDQYLVAEGGRIGKQEGGLMNLGGMEKDYRNDGGFVPLGGEEKADDVPARLSKNEFVFTADAVRNAGGGDIDKGAEVMENVMKNLEAGGKVSEESQGQGAQEMFEVSERLSEVV